MMPWVVRLCACGVGSGGEHTGNLPRHAGDRLGVARVNGNRKLPTFWSAPLEVDSFGWKD